MLEFLYGTPAGRLILKLLTNPKLSVLCGKFLDSKYSRFLIKGFIKKNNIDMSEYETRDFGCFNDCFYRQIKEECRPVNMDADALIAPCDGLLSAYRIKQDTVFPVKQSHYTVESLLRDTALAREFEDGICLVYRLCVDNYHRYSYFDSGSKGENIHIDGILHTVRPVALRKVPVFIENSREYTIMNTDNFGKAIQMEVGAMMVGKIVNLHEECEFERGEEKGHFEYGGSTIIVLLKKNAATINPKIFRATKNGKEVRIKLGQKIGIANR